VLPARPGWLVTNGGRGAARYNSVCEKVSTDYRTVRTALLVTILVAKVLTTHPGLEHVT